MESVQTFIIICACLIIGCSNPDNTIQSTTAHTVPNSSSSTTPSEVNDVELFNSNMRSIFTNEEIGKCKEFMVSVDNENNITAYDYAAVKIALVYTNRYFQALLKDNYRNFVLVFYGVPDAPFYHDKYENGRAEFHRQHRYFSQIELKPLGHYKDCFKEAIYYHYGDNFDNRILESWYTETKNEYDRFIADAFVKEELAKRKRLYEIKRN